MSYLKFDKSQIVNLEYSLQREMLRTNRAGSYCSSSLARCNTRKYHGLLVCPIDEIGGGKHVLLSSLDETIVQHGAAFNLGLHRYQGEHYNPKGHKYIIDFEFDVNSKTTYRVGEVVLTVERLLVEKKKQVLLRYTLLKAPSPVHIQFRPFLAFRNIHSLSKANMYANTKYELIKNGIRMKLYEGYPFLNMQFSESSSFIPIPDWYYNLEYFKELERGYEGCEDLFVPGYFDILAKEGEIIIFSGSTEEEDPELFNRRFVSETKKREGRGSFQSCLNIAARQFMIKEQKAYGVVAGFPWYNSITRQTLIALPGLTLSRGEEKMFEKVLKTIVHSMKDGLFPRTGDPDSDYNDCDSPLIFFWTLQQLVKYRKDTVSVWKQYGALLKDILTGYREGLPNKIGMTEDGLLTAGDGSKALTWMDGYVNGRPVTPRAGMPVEVNALWYNAICFALELAKQYGDSDFVSEWEPIAARSGESFLNTFWCGQKEYLADYVDGKYKDWTVRPNMILATVLDYSPLDQEKKKLILNVAKNDLVTPRGIRSLSPRDPAYVGIMAGGENERSAAMHQGCAYPWILGLFIERYLSIHKKGGLSFAKSLLKGFEEEMTENSIGTISEVYDGDPPHRGHGAISQAWNVACILHALAYVKEFEKQ